LTTESADALAVQPPQSKPGRRGRTALLMAAAVVLGVLGGGAAGYAAQSAGAPTPLPTLAVPQPGYPAARVAAPALSADQDDMVRTDGDLTRLLVPTPRGATLSYGFGSFDSWENIAQYAEGFQSAASEFGWLSAHSFRRAAVASWNQGSASYNIQLVQFDHADEANSLLKIQDDEKFAKNDSGGGTVALSGSNADEVVAGTIRHSVNGSGYYQGDGFGVHGDIAVEIIVQDTDGPVGAQTLRTVLQSQLERL